MNKKFEFELTPDMVAANAFYYLATKTPSRHYLSLEKLEFYYRRLRSSAYYWDITLKGPKDTEELLNFILSRPDIFHYFKNDKLIVLNDDYNPNLLYYEFLYNIPSKVKNFLDAVAFMRYF